MHLLKHIRGTNGPNISFIFEILTIINRGDDVSSLEPPFDYIVGTDVLFKSQMVDPLIKSLLNLSSKSTVIIIGT